MSNLPSLEDSLSQATPRPREAYADELRSRALQTFDQVSVAPRTVERPRIRPRWGWATALAFVLLIGVFFTSPGKAFAQAILQFGLFIFTDEPSAAEQMLTATPETVYTLAATHVDLSSASAQAGFPVYYPGFVPTGYGAFDPANPVEVVFNSAGEVLNVGAMFTQQENGWVLSFTQIPFEPDADTPSFPFGTGEADPQTVSVDGNEGIWLENFSWGTKLDENGNSVPVPYNLLIWQMEQEGHTFQFWLGSEEQLPLGVMVQIAESVGP